MLLGLRTYHFAYLMGIVGYILFIPLDWLIYPSMKWVFFAIRAVIVLFFVCARIVVLRSSDDSLRQRLVVLSILIMALGLSLMCLLSGDGYACQYYVGLCQIIVAISVIIGLKPKYFTISVIGIVLQHGLLLSLGPWNINAFIVSSFALTGIALLAVFAHNVIYHLTKENMFLKGFLPICAKCKQIRDSSGHWNKIEEYITNRAKVEFTHGLCPDCAQKLFPTEKQT
jgi:hypothetical protein